MSHVSLALFMLCRPYRHKRHLAQSEPAEHSILLGGALFYGLSGCCTTPISGMPTVSICYTGGLDIKRNTGALTQIANVLYLDAPSGVGLSYSDTHADYVTNDTRTAHDNNIFLRKFFALYPGFVHNDFYISGMLLTCVCLWTSIESLRQSAPSVARLAFELPYQSALRIVCAASDFRVSLVVCCHTTGESYAGVYVPTLAQEVLKGNDEGQQPHLRLKVALYSCGNHSP